MIPFSEFKTNITRRHFFEQGSHALGAAAVEGMVPQDKARSIMSEWARLGPVPRRQFESLFTLAERMNGSRTITLDQIRWLYDGSLLWRASSMADMRGRRAL